MEIIDFKNWLHKYKNFQECILLRIEWLDYCKTVELKFDNIWNDIFRLKC